MIFEDMKIGGDSDFNFFLFLLELKKNNGLAIGIAFAYFPRHEHFVFLTKGCANIRKSSQITTDIISKRVFASFVKYDCNY